MIKPIADSTASLRAHFRAARRALSQEQQESASRSVAQHLTSSAAFHHAESIAFYLAADGELDLHVLIDRALESGKRCFLPVADPDDLSLRFFAYHGNESELVKNRWGLFEPDPARQDAAEIAPHELDLVVLPLVACDSRGTRLGMGKGFYDRAFAFTTQAHGGSNPLLLGAAHDCQVSAMPLPREPWDVPLHAIATPSQLLTPPE